MPPDYIDIEELRRFLASGGGTNLAGQSLATDPTYSSGQQYAQQIAGGVIPNSQVIAPGVSYSPDQPGGYTQEGLNLAARDARIAELKKDLVWPDVPTTGESYTMEDQMPYAPPGVKEPTIWTPDSTMGDMLFPNIDYLQGLDFSGLPALGNIDVDAIIKEYQDRQDAGEPEPFESFFTEPTPAPVTTEAPATSGLFDITPELIAKQIEKQKIEGIEPVSDRFMEDQIIPSFVPQSVINQVPVMPQPVAQEPVYQIPNFPIQQPKNFTGLPNIPEMPNIPVMPQAPVTIADSVTPGLFDITPELIAKQIEKQKIETAEPIYDRYIDEQIIPSFVPQSVINQVPVMPEMPIYQEPIYQEPINIPQITNLPIQQPMNFTGLPQVQEPVYQKPMIQEPVYQEPV